MSIELLNAAFKADVRPSGAKFVLVALCDYANEEGLAYPSIETLCNKTSLNRKTVIKHLHTLCDQGVIMDTGGRVGRTRSIPKYRIFIGAVPKTGQHKQAVPKQPLSNPKNGTAKQSQNATEAVPKLDTSSTKKGIAKQSQNWDTEPPVFLTTREPPGGTRQGAHDNPERFRLCERWRPTIPQIAWRTMAAAGMDDETLEHERELFVAHHSIEGTQRTEAHWNKSFAHTLMKRIREGQSTETRNRNGTYQKINSKPGAFDPGSTDWQLPERGEIT